MRGHRAQRAGGSGLAGVLTIMGVAALAAFTLAAVTTAHSQRAQRAVNSQDALYLAEGALARTVGRLKADATFGTKGETLTYGTDTQIAIVSFDPKNKIAAPLSGVMGVPWSTNNCDGASGAGWGGCAVSTGTVHVVANGFAGGCRRTVEAIVGVPTYPYVVSSSGSFTSSGSLVVAGATSSAAYLAAPDTSASGPSNLGAQGSVTVEGECTISGDVVAQDQKTISLPLKATIGGVVRSGTVRLPDIPLQRYDPLNLVSSAGTFTDSSIGETDKTLAVSDCRHYSPPSGTLAVKGSLSLDNAIVYVDGSVVVEGALRGRGMLVVTGDAVIKGAIDLASAKSDQLVALMVGGNVTLSGSSVASSYFQGLVYARGRFSASHLTIAGIFMSGGGFAGAARAANPDGAMVVDSVKAVYLPEAANLSIQIGPPQVQDIFTSGATAGNSVKGTGLQAFAYDPTQANSTKTSIYNETMKRVSKTAQFGLRSTAGYPGAGEVGFDSTAVLLPMDGGTKTLLVHVNSLYHDIKTGKATQAPRADMMGGKNVYVPDISWVMGDRYDVWVSDKPFSELSTKTQSNIYDDFKPEWDKTNQQALAARAGMTLGGIVDFGYNAQTTLLTVIGEKTGGSTQGSDSAVVSIDLNQFFGTDRPLRVISWKEHE